MSSLAMAQRDKVITNERYRAESIRSREARDKFGEREPGGGSVLIHEEIQTRSGLYSLARVAALVSIVLGAIILAGWWFGWPILQGGGTGRSRIPPNGGLISLLLGIGLLSKIEPHCPALCRVAGNLAAIFVAALGLLTLLENIFGWDTRLDLLIFAKVLPGPQLPEPARLSFPGALDAFCLGIGIALLDVRVKGVWLTQVFAVVAGLVTLLALVGHLCHVPEFYGQLSRNRSPGMPLQGALGLLLIGVGLLCARPQRGLIAILWSYSPGGMLARWLLLAPAGGLVLTGAVYLVLTHGIPVDRAVRTWFLGISNLFFVTIPILGAAHALHKIGIQRDRDQQELEERVEQRTAELSEANKALHAEITERQGAEKALREARDHLEVQAAQLEQRVQERTARLAETVGDLEAFSYSVAHDMRAPLRGMQGFAHLLIEEHASRLDPEARDYLDRIASSAARMDLLIRDALDYTQVLRAETEMKPVDLDAITRELLSTFPGWQPPTAEIEITGTLPTVLGHEGFIVQCLTNLVGNAVKFVAPGMSPRVKIWSETIESNARLYIEDNGIGIPPKHHDRIFRMFERLNGADEYEGTGIGLAVVRKAVERMKGSVDFESEPGRGTRFWLEFKKAI